VRERERERERERPRDRRGGEEIADVAARGGEKNLFLSNWWNRVFLCFVKHNN
jgi:hypothetical protein